MILPIDANLGYDRTADAIREEESNTVLLPSCPMRPKQNRAQVEITAVISSTSESNRERRDMDMVQKTSRDPARHATMMPHEMDMQDRIKSFVEGPTTKRTRIKNSWVKGMPSETRK
jgi:hypothetical protein